jgi:hypothetical protein
MLMSHRSAVTFDTVCLIIFVYCVLSFRWSLSFFLFSLLFSVSNFYFTSQCHTFPPSSSSSSSSSSGLILLLLLILHYHNYLDSVEFSLKPRKNVNKNLNKTNK